MKKMKVLKWFAVTVGILIIILILLMTSCAKHYYEHYLVVCEDYKNNRIDAYRVPSEKEVDMLYLELKEKSGGRFNFYSEHKIPKKKKDEQDQ